MTVRTSTRVRTRRAALTLVTAVALIGLVPPTAQADERRAGAGTRSQQSVAKTVELRREAAALEQRLAGAEAVSRAAARLVARLTERTARLAELADRLEVRAETLHARAVERDTGAFRALLDLVRPGASDLDLATAAAKEHQHAEARVGAAVVALATAREEAAEAEAAWSAVVAESARVESRISAQAVIRLAMAQAGFRPSYAVAARTQDDRNRAALTRWKHYLGALADSGVAPPGVEELADLDTLAPPLRPLRDAAGEVTPGVARVLREGRRSLPVLPAETVRAVSAAFSRVGRPAEDGADACGGLLGQVWGKAGIDLPSVSQAQWRSLASVPARAVQVGDAVYIDDPRYDVRQVGLYVGAHQMIAVDPTGGVVRVRPVVPGRVRGIRRVTLTTGGRSVAGRPAVNTTGCGTPARVTQESSPYPAVGPSPAGATAMGRPWWAPKPAPAPRTPPTPVPVPAPVPAPAPAPAPPPDEDPRPPAQGSPRQFTLASFNVLGDSHTRPGGNKRGWADSTTRMRAAVTLLGQYGADMVGFQELQGTQARDFHRMTGGAWGLYSTPGNTQNAVAWKKNQFTLVHGRTVPIPYFRGNIQQMPVVRLRSTATGQEIYLANFHNPASTRRHPGSAKWRTEATRRELALVEQLRGSGIPILVTGDMNEKAEFFCAFTAGGFMHAAAGGSNQHRCLPPRNAGIDWIFGSRDISFSGYSRDRSALVRRATDHPLVLAEVTLPAR